MDEILDALFECVVTSDADSQIELFKAAHEFKKKNPRKHSAFVEGLLTLIREAEALCDEIPEGKPTLRIVETGP